MFSRLLISLFFFAAVFSSSAQANTLNLFSDPEFLPPEQAFPVTTELEGKQFNATFNTPKGYYLYKHRIYLIQDGQTYWPQSYSKSGIQKQDENFGEVEVFYQDLSLSFELSKLSPTSASFHYQGCAEAGLCYAPQKINIDLSHLKNAANKPEVEQKKTETQSKPEPTENNSWFADQSLLQTIGLFFLAGIALTFTPCVLPMVPILTSVVLGQENRTAKEGFVLSSLYVLGMALTFAVAGLTVGFLGAGANLQALMQTPWVLIVFALLFVLLAFSMFGFYELSLPNSLAQKLDKLSRKQKSGQALGVFIMGALSALVVSPCVSAPLAGALIYLSTTSDALLGGFALLALGLGMGAPLIVLGTTGASVLPKAGAWMDEVKNLFGVLLIAVAIWLLTRIVPANISLLLWALLAIFYAVYLGALEEAKTTWARMVKAAAILLLTYGIVALVGFFQGASDPIYPLAKNSSTTSQAPNSDDIFYTTADVTELDEIIEQSTQPVMVDVYADWCVSCKEMEKSIFRQIEVQKRLKDYRWIKLDITEQTTAQTAWLKRYQLFGPPAVLFFSAAGQEIQASRTVGEQSLSDFLKRIATLENKSF